VNALMEQFLEEFFGDVSFIHVEVAKQFFDEFSHFQRFSMIGITGGEY
jgi:hypothetical protein